MASKAAVVRIMSSSHTFKRSSVAVLLKFSTMAQLGHSVDSYVTAHRRFDAEIAGEKSELLRSVGVDRRLAVIPAPRRRLLSRE